MSLDSKILQILDSSACLSKGQLSGYLSRSLYPEEVRAVELHLSECPFCSDALDGLEQEQDAQKVLGNIARLPVLPPLAPRESRVEAVLDKVVKTVSPRTQQDAVVPAKSNMPEKGAAGTMRETGTRPPASGKWWKPLGIAAGLFIVIAALWYLRPESNDDHKPEGYIAENRSLQATGVQPAETSGNTTAAAGSQPPAALKNTAPVPDTGAVKPKKTISARDTVALKALATESKIAVKDEGARPAANSARMADAVSGAGVAETLKAAAPAAARNEKTEEAAKSVADKEESATDKKQTARQDNKMSDYEMGVELYKQKQYGSALLYLKPAQRNAADPKHYDAVYYSALCYKNSGQKKKAVQLFKKLVEEGAPQKSSAQKQLKELGED